MGTIFKTDKILCIILWLILGEISSPGHKFSFFTYIQFIPIFYLLRKNKQNWLKLSIISGLLYYCVYYRWLIYPLKYTNFPPYIIGSLNVFLMSVYQTLYFVIFSFFFVYFTNNFRFILLPAIWGINEILKAHLFTGFPWGELSYNLFNMPIFINIGYFIKSEGISSFIIFINLVIFSMLFEKKYRKIYFLIFIITTSLYCSFNYYLIKKEKFSSSLNLKIAIIQGNIPEEIKILDKNAKLVLETYIKLTKSILQKQPDLVIWPEAIYTVPFENDNSSLKKYFLNFVYQNKLNLIFGSPFIDIDYKNFTFKVFNSMYFIKKNKIYRYDKIHLVPFGEYTPLKKLLFFVNKIVPGEDFSSGSGIKLFKLKHANIIPLICYEGIFRDLIRKGLKKGGNLIVNISNEAWFGDSYALWQHLAANVLRAVEARKYFIKCANSGISAIISPKGDIISYIPPNKKGIIVSTLK